MELFQVADYDWSCVGSGWVCLDDCIRGPGHSW